MVNVESRSQTFEERYGPWALIAGASEGVGASIAKQLAERGLNLLLLARNGPLLDEVASEINNVSGVSVRVLQVDLTAPDMLAQVTAATSDLQVGLLVYNAGAVNHVAAVLDEPLARWLSQIAINCIGPVTLIRALGPAMRDRGRGGIILVGSTACIAGTPTIVVYSAAKMFEVNLAEGLWAELHPFGVDVCCTVIGGTHTPARSRVVGVGYDPAVDMLSEDVASDILANFASGPTYVVGEANRALASDWMATRERGTAMITAAMDEFEQRKVLQS